MITLGKRLRKARRLRKMTQAELGKIIGTSPNQISMIESGQSGPSIRTVVAAATALEVSTDFLTGLIEDPVSTRQLQHELDRRKAQIFDLKRHRPFEPWDEGTTYVEVTDIETAAGEGIVVHREPFQAKSMMEFPRAWLRNHGLNPYQCRVLTVNGESMEPTLTDGCPILIDLKKQDQAHNRIYVIRTGDELIVKRVMHDREAGWLIVSDNPDKNRYPTAPFREDARVIAEVKWWGQSLGEGKLPPIRPEQST